MKLWAVTNKGIVRQDNQDTYFAYCDDEKSTALFVVCDGMGGARAGNVASMLASEMFADQIKSNLITPEKFSDAEQIMRKAAEAVNTAVFKKSRSGSEFVGMGTTLVTAFVSGNTATVLNIGDSRAYHVNKGRISQITRDHSVVEDMVECGDITRAESKTHPNKNLITRAVGTSPDVACDVFNFNIEDGDFIFLCSDGLSNTVDDQEILYEVLRGGAEDSCCDRLLNLAISRGAPDNVTMVLFKY